MSQNSTWADIYAPLAPPCSEICQRLVESLPGGKDHFRPVTGLPVSTYFSAYKAQWMVEHSEEVRGGRVIMCMRVCVCVCVCVYGRVRACDARGFVAR
jgi:hypothetical protein